MTQLPTGTRPLLALALAAGLAAPAPAQDLFEGLSTGNGSAFGQAALDGGTGDGTARTGELSATDAYPLQPGAHPTSASWDQVAGALKEADARLRTVMENYAAIHKEAERQTDGGRNKFFFSDLARYNKAVRHADDLSAAILAAHGKLKEVAPTIATMEASDEPAWALEARIEHTRLVTIYNQMLDWANRRILKYDTSRWGDEQVRQLLTTKWDAKTLPLPASPGVREETHMSASITEPLTARYLGQVSEALDRADAARDILERERIKPATAEDERRTLAGWILYRYTTVSIFDTLIKRKAVEFALAMVEAKAAMNAALLATEAPSRGKFSEKSHMDLRRAMMRYAPLAWYGDYRFLQVVSSWGFLQRELWIFDGAGFRDAHRIETDGIESNHLKDVLDYFQSEGRRSTLD